VQLLSDSVAAASPNPRPPGSAKPAMPFHTTWRLYGWPQRPGIYCDLLRSRGLDISAARLQETDVDGDFDDGLRPDLNSQRADVLSVKPRDDHPE
jgi:hypothetical protein